MIGESYDLTKQGDGCMEKYMIVNGKKYEIIKFLGKGKGGYSYLATDGMKQYVLNQIHHEPLKYVEEKNGK